MNVRIALALWLRRLSERLVTTQGPEATGPLPQAWTRETKEGRCESAY